MKVLTPVIGYRYKGPLKRGSKDPGPPKTGKNRTRKIKRSRKTKSI